MSKKCCVLLFVLFLAMFCGCSVKTASTALADTTEVLATAATPLKSTEESTDSSQPTTNSESLTSSSLLEKLAMLIPAPEEKTRDDYFSEIRTEDIRRINDENDGSSAFSLRFDDDGNLYIDFSIDGQYYSRFVNKTLEYPFLSASGKRICGQTLRKIYCLSADEKTLMQIDPITAKAVTVYTTDRILRLQTFGWLKTFGCNIVVFVEQMADGTWRVLRLYEPDGTVDVIEENLSEVAEIKIISNCEFVTMWKNPAYQAVEDANVAAIWADWAPEDEPYPGREEADRISNFHEVLPEDVFDRTGVFNYYSRYRNTLSGKTVTVGCIVGCAPLHDYCLLDGTPWTLSRERLYADWEKYDMPRFWLYLPDDDAGGGFNAQKPTTNASILSILHPDE